MTDLEDAAMGLRVTAKSAQTFGAVVREVERDAPVTLRSERRLFVTVPRLSEDARRRVEALGASVVEDRQFDMDASR
jgi:hypothetical protein